MLRDGRFGDAPDGTIGQSSPLHREIERCEREIERFNRAFERFRRSSERPRGAEELLEGSFDL